jgi:hypothetical protein
MEIAVFMVCPYFILLVIHRAILLVGLLVKLRAGCLPALWARTPPSRAASTPHNGIFKNSLSRREIFIPRWGNGHIPLLPCPRAETAMPVGPRG